MSDAPELPTLDRSGEAWRGCFPGLGEIRVGADGAISVEISPGGRAEQAHAALRSGWGDLLSWVRRGTWLALAAAVVPAEARTPADAPAPALLVSGPPADVAWVHLSLTLRGWSLLSDLPSPLLLPDSSGEHITVMPRISPALVPWGLAHRLGVAVTDDHRVDSPAAVVRDQRRSTSAAALGAVVHLERGTPGAATLLTPLTGHQALRAAHRLLLQGAARPHPADPQADLLRVTRLAARPHAMLTWTGEATRSIDALEGWWNSLSIDAAAP